MSFDVALPLAYAASMAGFFAVVGRRNGVWWVVVPLLVGAGLGTALLTLGAVRSPLFTPVAIATVFSPVAVAYANRLTGYRWWPTFSISRRLLVAWLVLGGLLLIGSVAVLVSLAISG